MAKRKTAKKSPRKTPREEPGETASPAPSVEQLYEKAKQEAVERIDGARQLTLGDVVDSTLKTVRKHPGPGLILAAAVGFFLGRLFRR